MRNLHQQATRLHTHTVVFTDGEDLECAILGLLGASTKGIIAATGLTLGQVKYRIKKADIQRREFRDGRTPFAKRIINLGRGDAHQVVQRTVVPKFSKYAAR